MRYVIKQKFSPIGYYVQVYNSQNIILTPVIKHARPMSLTAANNIVRDLDKSLTTRGAYVVVSL